MALDSILITGCSEGGLGAGIVLAVQKRNLHVFVTARDISKLSYLSDLSNITILTLDVTSSSSIAAAVETVQSTNDGRLKYLVNNSGVGMVMPLLDVEVEDAKKVFDVNLWGLLAVTKTFAPLIVKERGTIVNVGSSAGVLNVPWNGIYGASKAAANLLSETLRLEMEPLGVKVLTIVAGIVKTNFFANLEDHFETPSKSFYKSLEKHIGYVANGGGLPQNVMTAEEFGRQVVVDVLAGKTGCTYTGTLGWSARLIPIFPAWVLDWYLRRRGGNLSGYQINKE